MTDTKTMGMLAHILGIFTGFVGPLIIYLVGDKDDNSRHALNFQLSMLIYYIISAILILLLIGILLIWALMIFNLVVCIIGAVKASKGEVYKYPLEIQFIK